MDWYIAISNEARKIPENVLIYKIRNHEVFPNTLVVNEKIKNWTELKNTEIWRIYSNGNTTDQFSNSNLYSKTGGYNENYEHIAATNTPQERCLGLAITGFVFSLVGLFILPIIFSVLGFIFGIIAVASNSSENNEVFKPVAKFKNKARGFGLSALVIGAIGIVLMIFNMLNFGGYFQ